MKNVFILLGMCIFSSCGTTNNVKETNSIKATVSKHIGLIPFDPLLDTLSFTVCNEDYVNPYFHHLDLSIEGEKPAIVDAFETQFNPVSREENGYVTIRFLVNCEGETGRFRMIELDKDYNPKDFSETLTRQLCDITSSLEGWDALTVDGASYDYVRYLTFKIQEGNITAILP